MRILDLLKGIEYSSELPVSDMEIKGLALDSRHIKEGDLFVAVRGEVADGHLFIGQALSCGALAAVVEEGRVKERGPFIKVKDSRRALLKLAANFYGNPYEKIKAIGITGTNGKTTVSYLVESILRRANIPCGRIGTIDYDAGGRIETATNTTPGPLELTRLLSRMVKQSMSHVVMEVSSHALAQNRIEGINFKAAIFTNITQDHLDFHKTFENYLAAKRNLFERLERRATAILNAEDPSVAAISKAAKSYKIFYGFKRGCDVRARAIKMDFNGSELELITPLGSAKIKTRLIGRHNVLNILAAASLGIAEKIKLKEIISGIEDVRGVPGRLEEVDCGTPFKVFVDYAHTEDALLNVLGILRDLPHKRIITVFGCGGERDRLKRPKMGKVGVELSDYVVLTSDNPRGEDPIAILEEIEKGIDTKFTHALYHNGTGRDSALRGSTNYEVEPDRHKAIEKALSKARAGDIVLVAGKGHERYQILKDGPIPHDDREVVRECLLSEKYQKLPAERY